MNLLTCEKVSLGYGSGVVVKDLSFKVSAGDYLCIVGENGAGKSTLVKTLLGLQKTLGGTITLNVTAGEVGYLPQQTQIQKDFPASVEEIILSGCLARKKVLPFYSAEDKKTFRRQYGAAWNFDACAQMFPRTFRRTTTARFIGKGVVRGEKNFVARRTDCRIRPASR